MTDADPATPPAMTSSPTPADPSPVAAEAVGAAAPAPPMLPERYDLVLEGYAIDPALIDTADPVLRDLGLTNDAANKLMPVAREIATRTQQSLVRQIEEAATTQKRAWHDAFVADPEIGGSRRGETEHLAARALDAMGFVEGHPFRQALNDSGFGNHPDMIRAFRRLGEMIGEDPGLVRPMSASSRTRPVWERLYPNETK